MVGAIFVHRLDDRQRPLFVKRRFDDTVMKSVNSTATLLCEPPPMSHTPCGQLLRLCADRAQVAVRMSSGTAIAGTATFVLTSDILISVELCAGLNIGSPCVHVDESSGTCIPPKSL